MTIRATILALALGTAFLLSPAANAGGPIIVEEPETADRDNGWIVPVIALLVIGALVAGGGDDAVEGPTPCTKNAGGGC